MASFRGALLSFNGGCAIIGRNTNFITGNGNNSIAWVARNGLPRSPNSPCAKTNLPLINCKPLTTLACKRFPILSFRNIGKGRVDVNSLWNSGVGLQTNRSLTSQPSKSIQPLCIGRTSRASEISGYLISSSSRAWKLSKKSSIGLTGSKALFSSKSLSDLDGNAISSPGSTSSAVPSSAKIDSLASMSTISSSQLSAHQGEGGVEVIYFRGLPQFTIPLPSRKERCRFIVKPLTNTVGDLLTMIRHEDKGVDRVTCLTTDGIRIASSNTIEMLMEHDFDMVVNDKMYRVLTPAQEKASKEDLERLSSVRNLVGQLYGALNVDEHQLRQEREMLTELEKLQNELGPLEDKRELINQVAMKRTNTLTWVGLGLMSVQFGILARLTWWEYSWDIMEPVTYFVTYGTAMLAYAYFVLTKQEYVLPDVRDREYLITFHKNAKKVGFDVDKYNVLKDQIYKIETDLHRLRDPLALHLPLKTRLGNQLENEYLSSESSQGIVSKIQQMFKKSGSTTQS
ncbi:unnamed protein product [Orchesella dallaii]|uniref:Calcium uniporter protein C-terminal domain-containing protein n=1 Tax=Orchesella dallaii TaxID=48710 RepID=A0ABP1QZW4_9HEXA